jgi:ATP-dependent DNA ligase
MDLPINPGYKPMEAKSASELPTGNHWQYEPKWDGFRCLAFRDGEMIELQSHLGGAQLSPELSEAYSCKLLPVIIKRK